MNPWADWSGLQALAGGTGPFPYRGFLESWWRHRGRGELLTLRAGDGAVGLVVDAGVVRFVGEADLTDYHSPLGDDLEPVVAALVSALAAGTVLALDSLPMEAAEPLMKQFAAAGVAMSMSSHDATMVLDLPRDPNAYLALLDAKQRHELRRKRRRFEEQAGIPSLVRYDNALEGFAAMHRTATGEKGEFMTPDMESFFGSLVTDAGGVIDLLLDGSGNPAAAAFGFEDADTYYLYNSAFAAERAPLSPGIVLVAELIAATIRSGRRRFDFLKGGEDYKVRLGARPRPLYRLEGAL